MVVEPQVGLDSPAQFVQPVFRTVQADGAGGVAYEVEIGGGIAAREDSVGQLAAEQLVLSERAAYFQVGGASELAERIRHFKLLVSIVRQKLAPTVLEDIKIHLSARVESLQVLCAGIVPADEISAFGLVGRSEGFHRGRRIHSSYTGNLNVGGSERNIRGEIQSYAADHPLKQKYETVVAVTQVHGLD